MISGSRAGGYSSGWCQTLSMVTRKNMGTRRAIFVAFGGAAIVALISTSTGALLARLTRIPLGRGTATITWTGAAAIRPTLPSVKGSAGGYSVSATGRVPNPASILGSASSVPSQIPLANVKGTVGGTPFTLGIVLTLPTIAPSVNPVTFGHATGSFRSQAVSATLTANSNSSSFGFKGTIGKLHIAGVVSQPRQHGNSETARATFDVTK